MIIDQCPIPWVNMSSNISFEYRTDGPQLVCNNREDITSIILCTSNGSWYPNPAEIICTQFNEGLLPYVIPKGAIIMNAISKFDTIMSQMKVILTTPNQIPMLLLSLTVVGKMTMILLVSYCTLF